VNHARSSERSLRDNRLIALSMSLTVLIASILKPLDAPSKRARSPVILHF
jgi:hypothetical protein